MRECVCLRESMCEKERIYICSNVRKREIKGETDVHLREMPVFGIMYTHTKTYRYTYYAIHSATRNEKFENSHPHGTFSTKLIGPPVTIALCVPVCEYASV